MAWFFFALICAFGWGFADLFYKKGTEEHDSQSHLKIAVWVGLVMGLCALVLLLFTRPEMTPGEFFSNILKYLPASLSYIISMVVGYAGLRYLELSIISPVQNASGALSAICMIVYFAFIGKITDFFEEFSVLDIIGSILIIAGVIVLAFVENHLSKEEVKEEQPVEKKDCSNEINERTKKYNDDKNRIESSYEERIQKICQLCQDAEGPYLLEIRMELFQALYRKLRGMLPAGLYRCRSADQEPQAQGT